MPASLGDDQALSITAGKGTINLVDGGSVTLNDSSSTNEGILQVTAETGSSAGILSTTFGSNPVIIQGAGIVAVTETTGANGGTVTLTGTEVDGSTTNELQTLSITAGKGTINLSQGGGAVILADSTMTNTLNLSGNTMTSTGDGVTDTSLVIGTHLITYSGNILTSSVNGVSDTALINAGGTGDILQDGNSFGDTLTIGTNDNFASSIEVFGDRKLYIDTTGNIKLTDRSAETDDAVRRLNINSNSSNTVINGFGGSIMFNSETTTTEDREQVEILARWEDATDATRFSHFEIKTIAGDGLLFPYQQLSGTYGGQIELGLASNSAFYRNTGIGLNEDRYFTIGKDINNSDYANAQVKILSTMDSVGAITLDVNDTLGTIRLGSTNFNKNNGTKTDVQFGSSWSPTNGNANFNWLKVGGAINQTGGANGTSYNINLDGTSFTNLNGTHIGLHIPFDHLNAKGINQTGELTTNYFAGKTTFDQHVKMKELTDPSTPASGYGELYGKTDGKVYWRNDGGTIYDLTQTGGGGVSTNVFSFNPVTGVGTSNVESIQDTALWYYQTLQENGSPKTRRANTDFLDGSEVAWAFADNAGNNSTEITGDIAPNAVDSTDIINAGISPLDLSQYGASYGQKLGWDGSQFRPMNDSLGTGGSGDILQNGNTLGADLRIGTNDNFKTLLEQNNDVKFEIDTAGKVMLYDDVSATSTVVDRLVTHVNSLNTAATGFGAGFLVKGETTTTNDRDMTRIEHRWLDATDASRDGEIGIKLATDGTLTEHFKFSQSGGASRLSIGTSTPLLIQHHQMIPASDYIIGGFSNPFGISIQSSATTNPIVLNASANTGGGIIGNTGFTHTTGNKIDWRFNGGYTTSSGNGTFTLIKADGTFNQTGLTSGKIKLIELSPTITSLTDTLTGLHIGMTNTNCIGINQVGADVENYFNGSTTFEAPILQREVAAPSTPATNYGATYAKTDGKLYFKNDAGTEYDLTATGAGGGADVITPAQITADQDNYNPTGFDAATIVRLSSNDIRAITSMAAQSSGERKTFMNVGSYMIYFPGEHPDGTAANRIDFGEDVILNPMESIDFIYDNTLSRWIPIYSRHDSYNSYIHRFLPGSITPADHSNVNFTQTGTGAGSTIVQPTATILFGSNGITTGSTATGVAISYMSKLNTIGMYGSGHISYETVVQIEDLSTGTDSFTVFSTVTNSYTNLNFVNANSQGIRYSHSQNGGKWTGYAIDNGAVLATVDLGITVAADTRYVLRTEVDKALSEIRFYINNSYAGRLTTRLPNAVAFGAKTGIQKGVGTNPRLFYLGKQTATYTFPQ